MPGVNGQEYQHALIKLNLVIGAPLRVQTFSKLNFGATAEKDYVQDAQGQPIGWVLRQQKLDGNLVLLLSEWIALKKQLYQVNPGLGLLQMRLDWSVTFGNQFLTIQTRKLNGVMFQKDPFDSENNQDPLYADIPLFILGVTDEFGNAPVTYT